jgi:hypothetical protein
MLFWLAPYPRFAINTIKGMLYRGGDACAGAEAVQYPVQLRAGCVQGGEKARYRRYLLTH